MISPLVTIAVPSFNQADFLNDALSSIFEQDVPVEVFVMDAGSTDGSIEIIRKWAPHLSGWRSRPDEGQAAAINEGISKGKAPYVCWINSDDFFLSGGLQKMLEKLSSHSDAPAVYGRVWNINKNSNKLKPVWVEPFSKKRLALRCIISQPGTLVRRNAWENINGLDENLQFSMDYDLWWRLFKKFGELTFLDDFVAVNRVHEGTKTRNFRQQHNDESVAVVKKHNGKVPIKWLLFRPYAVWFRTIFG